MGFFPFASLGVLLAERDTTDGISTVNHHKQLNSFRACLLVLSALASFSILARADATLAQTGVRNWSSPVNISNMPETYSVGARIAADPFGNVHVVWNEAAEGDSSGNTPISSIYYIRWDGEAWSAPIDIVAQRDNLSLYAWDLKTDTDGWVHLLYKEQNTLFHAWARVDAELSAQSWSTEVVVSDAYDQGDFLIANDGRFHVAYIAGVRGDGVNFVSSDGVGASWTTPAPVWTVPTDDVAARYVRIAQGNDGTIHATWSENSSELNWNASGIWYARSLDDGQTWQDTWYQANQGSWPNVALDSEQRIHLLWDYNVSSEDGRGHAMSLDSGLTWQDPIVLFNGAISGRSGWPEFVQDSSDALFHLTSGQGFGKEGGIWISQWTGSHWKDPSLISEPLRFSEGPAAAVFLGNSLFAVWHDFGENDIMFSTWKSSAPEISPLAIPSVEPTPVSQPTQPAMSRETDMALNPVVARTLPLDHELPSTQYPSRSAALVLGIAPAAIVVLAVIVLRVNRKRS